MVFERLKLKLDKIMVVVYGKKIWSPKVDIIYRNKNKA